MISNAMTKIALATLLYCLSAAVLAQDVSGAAHVPTVPQSLYQSAFEGYQPFQDTERQSWRTANDEIAKTDHMGGMGGMKKEAEPSPKLNGPKPPRSAAQQLPLQRPAATAGSTAKQPAKIHAGMKGMAGMNATDATPAEALQPRVTTGMTNAAAVTPAAVK